MGKKIMQVLRFQYEIIENSEYIHERYTERWEEVSCVYFDYISTDNIPFKDIEYEMWNDYKAHWERLEYGGIDDLNQLRTLLYHDLLYSKLNSTENRAWIEYWIAYFDIKTMEFLDECKQRTEAREAAETANAATKLQSATMDSAIP